MLPKWMCRYKSPDKDENNVTHQYHQPFVSPYPVALVRIDLRRRQTYLEV